MARPGTFTSSRNPKGKAEQSAYAPYTLKGNVERYLKQASESEVEKLFYNLRKTALRRMAALGNQGYLDYGKERADIVSARWAKIPDLSATFKGTMPSDRAKVIASMAVFVVSGPSVSRIRESKRRRIERTMQDLEISKSEAEEMADFIDDYYENAVAGKVVRYQYLQDFFSHMTEANVDITNLRADPELMRKAVAEWERRGARSLIAAEQMKASGTKHTYEEFSELLGTL